MPTNHPHVPHNPRLHYHPTGDAAESWRRVQSRAGLGQVMPPHAMRGPSGQPSTHPHTFPSHVPFMNHDPSPILENHIWTRPPELGGAQLVHTFTGVRNRTVHVYQNPHTHSFIYLYGELEPNAH